MSAASFGVAQDDLAGVGKALNMLFNYKCAPPTTVIPSQGMQLQSICIADACPLADNATCSSYQPAMKPAVANATLVGNSSSTSSGAGGAGGASKTSGMPSSTGSSPATVSKAGAATVGMSFAAVAGGLAAMFL